MSWLTVISVERHLLLNPWHPQAQRIRILGGESFAFDSRLF
jgi:hypothetical protein